MRMAASNGAKRKHPKVVAGSSHLLKIDMPYDNFGSIVLLNDCFLVVDFLVLDYVDDSTRATVRLLQANQSEVRARARPHTTEAKKHRFRRLRRAALRDREEVT